MPIERLDDDEWPSDLPDDFGQGPQPDIERLFDVLALRKELARRDRLLEDREALAMLLIRNPIPVWNWENGSPAEWVKDTARDVADRIREYLTASTSLERGVSCAKKNTTPKGSPVYANDTAKSRRINDMSQYSRVSHYSLPQGMYIQILYPNAIPAEEMEDVLLWLDLVRKQISRIGIAVVPKQQTTESMSGEKQDVK